MELINELLFCERQSYLESEHTLAHFRQVGWNPRLFDRRYCDHGRPAPCGDEKMLQQADQSWRQRVASQPAPTLDPAMLRELDRIVSAAQERDELDLGLLAQLAGELGVSADFVEAPGEHAHDDAMVNFLQDHLFIGPM